MCLCAWLFCAHLYPSACLPLSLSLYHFFLSLCLPSPFFHHSSLPPPFSSTKRYASGNMKSPARTGLQYILKIAASVAESIVFLVLGIELVLSVESGWNSAFTFSMIFGVLFIRCVIIFALCEVAKLAGFNHITPRTQFIIGYGGLRGAVAFALAVVLLQDKQLCDADKEPFSPFRSRELIVSTTIAIVMFTTVVQVRANRAAGRGGGLGTGRKPEYGLSFQEDQQSNGMWLNESLSTSHS